MLIDCISDLHGFYPKLEGGDLLIIAGDLTAKHTGKEFYDFAMWTREQDYEDIIVVAGNHDTWLIDIDNPNEFWHLENWVDTGEFTYLCDTGTELENGIKIWGSPWTPWFDGVNPHCCAFMTTEIELEKKYKNIPDDIHILISHGPFQGVLDQNVYDHYCGISSLRDSIDRIKPKLFVCGHIHEQGGKQIKHFETICVNCSHVNENYKPVNAPTRIIF